VLVGALEGDGVKTPHPKVVTPRVITSTGETSDENGTKRVKGFSTCALAQ
jgi:hypothetical protein